MPGNSGSSLYLTSTGNVGIGTTSPTGLFHVSGIAAGNATMIVTQREVSGISLPFFIRYSQVHG